MLMTGGEQLLKKLCKLTIKVWEEEKMLEE